MSFMIIPVICMCVAFGLAIRPAIEHDRRNQWKNRTATTDPSTHADAS